MCKGGILYVIFGVDILLAIMNISYTDIKKCNIGSCQIEVVQYPKIPNAELQKLLSDF